MDRNLSLKVGKYEDNIENDSGKLNLNKYQVYRFLGLLTWDLLGY